MSERIKIMVQAVRSSIGGLPRRVVLALRGGSMATPARRMAGMGMLLGAIGGTGYFVMTHPPIHTVAPGHVGVRMNQLTGSLTTVREGALWALPGVHSVRELALVDNERQPYIHYQKGAMAMYQLQEVLGEVRVNQVLQQLLARHAFSGPPYPSAPVLVDALRAAASPEQAYLIDDLFEAIVLYDNRAIAASAVRRANGQYLVTLRASAQKMRVGADGGEHEAPMHDHVAIGVDDRDGNPLLRERRVLGAGEATFTMLVKGRPARAGIDPDNKLIDRKPGDNMIEVE